MKQTEKETQGTSNTNETNGRLLEKFFKEQLQDIYYAEQQLVKALTEMKEAATTEELEDAFAEHKTQTERHVKRLERIFEKLGMPAKGKQCKAMDGLIEEAKSIIKDTKKNSMTRDAALIIAAQKVEHYEIATYGGLLQLALTIGKNSVADLLQRTLLEEENTDQLLTYIAENDINLEADQEDESSVASGGSSSSESKTTATTANGVSS